MYQAMKAVLQNPRVESLLIVLIGGFNRMDEMAEGILKYREKHGLDVPMVVRMCGTLEEVGNQMMEEAGIPTYEDLHKSVKAAVRKAQGGDECLS
jgi:succinyl-CoA synthetase beta subunit